jgi:hypothetical protein
MPTLSLKVEIGTGRITSVRGRAAWSLEKLIASGPTGCSAFDIRAPRWSGYVHKLRNLGVVIDTVRERHGGRFPGYHARYVLRSQVTVLEAAGY